ncbi:Dyp-type peroxidase [Tsukamurella soli]|uniref:Dyp-type peroxidase n=1 Tax=Tsukamurella soli TaxID=644556 RepID=UPI0031E50E9A
MSDPTAQPILDPSSVSAIFLVLTIDPGGEEQVNDTIADLTSMVRATGFRYPDRHLSLIASIGSEAWDRLFTGPRPAGLHRFVELDGPRHRAPSTPGDLLLHIRAGSKDLCFELARNILNALAGAVTVEYEVDGFRFFDNRDLLGFVDGTENPAGTAAVDAVLIGAEDPDFAGGSYVIAQKYLHDMGSWRSLSTEEQERVIGRTKLEDIEFPDADKAPTAHIVLNQVNDADGNQLQIMRENMPFGEVGRGEYGTYFIGYARTPAVTEQMLRNMFIGEPPGVTDRILDFSTAVTGGLFFTPSVDFLDNPPDLPAGPPGADRSTSAEPPSEPAPQPPADGSLAIGSLKGIK